MFLRTRLLLGILGVVFVGGVFTVASIGMLAEGRMAFDEYNTYQEAQDVMQHMNVEVHTAALETLEYILTDNPVRKEEALSALSHLDNHTQRYRNLSGVPFKENVSRINVHADTTIREALSTYEQEGQEEAFQALTPVLHREEEVMTLYHGEIPAAVEQQEKRLGVRVEDSFQDVIVQFILGSVVALLIASLLAVVLTRSVSTPIQRLQSIIRSISRGEMEHTIDESLKGRDDEIGSLARAFDRTLVSLKLAMERSEEEGEAGTDDSGGEKD